ncbi:MAG: YitT family protein [Clostridiales bacterium]|nr:YitT family protein [Clostridiales bacterium]
MTKKKAIYNFVWVPLAIIVSGFLRAMCVLVFILPYNFAPGGATGIGTMVEYATVTFAGFKFSAGYVMLIVNAPLLVFAFFKIDRGFAIKTGSCIIIYSLLIALLQHLGWDEALSKVLQNDGIPELSACASGVLGGVGLSIMLKIGGSTGGTDIIATYIQRKFSATHVSWFIYGLDAIVVFASAFVYRDGLTPILLSLVEMFCLSMMSDTISSGFKSALKFEIITHEPEAISNELITKLRRGVTCVPAKGMYSGKEQSMLICVIRKRQLSDFYAILNNYPDTFAYVSSTSEVMGLGFSRWAELDNTLKVIEHDKKAEAAAAANGAETTAAAEQPADTSVNTGE